MKSLKSLVRPQHFYSIYVGKLPGGGESRARKRYGGTSDFSDFTDRTRA